MNINLNKAHFPVTVLGPGRRIGIWLQGCRIGCNGCLSRDTWDATVNQTLPVARLLDWCERVSIQNAGLPDAAPPDGITISGGEPFDQPDALAALLDGLHAWRNRLKSDLDILCYSGYPYTRLQSQHGSILGRLDAVIPEPFIDSSPTRQLWRGSDNQTLQLLTERARTKYAPYVNATGSAQPGKQIQAMLDGEKVWYIGIPQRGDMSTLEQRCKELDRKSVV